MRGKRGKRGEKEDDNDSNDNDSTRSDHDEMVKEQDLSDMCFFPHDQAKTNASEKQEEKRGKKRTKRTRKCEDPKKTPAPMPDTYSMFPIFVVP